MMITTKLCLVCIALGGLSLTGCFGGDGPTLVPVSGTVTMDGEPLEGVVVSFYPTGDGNASMSQTDGEGHYELQFTADKLGVMPGEYIVEIITPIDDSTGEPVGPKIPSQYNEESTLTATVTDSSDTFDFDLTTEP